MRPLRFHFDYIDPASRVMDLRLRRLAGLELEGVELAPREVRTPDMPPLDPASPSWTAYWATLNEQAPEEMSGLRMPSRLPHTRKAHELVLHAAEVDAKGEGSPPGGSRAALHSAIFRAALEEGRDIGRVDVLVELAVAAGLDRTEARAVLDVDRHTGEVERMRAAALDTGVVGVPTVVCGGELLEGLHDLDAIRAFVTEETHDD